MLKRLHRLCCRRRLLQPGFACRPLARMHSRAFCCSVRRLVGLTSLLLVAMTTIWLLGATAPATAHGNANAELAANADANHPPPPPVRPQPLNNLSASSFVMVQPLAEKSQQQASPSVADFLRRVAEVSGGQPQQLSALRTKISLLNQLAALQTARGTTLVDRAKSCSRRLADDKSLGLRYVQAFSYLHNEPGICTGQLLLLAAVHSNAKNANRRATIRRTWGSLRYVGSSRLQLVFFLGSPGSARLQADIDAESRRYRDIVQLDFSENYRNMSLKHLSIYEWMLGHCPGAQYLLKVDDDTFTDVVHLVAFLQHSPPEGFYCSNTRGAKPQRLKRGPKAKWAVSRYD